MTSRRNLNNQFFIKKFQHLKKFFIVILSPMKPPELTIFPMHAGDKIKKGVRNPHLLRDCV